VPSSLGRLLLAAGGAWLVVVLLAAVFQRQLIYLPDRTIPTPPPDVEEVVLTTEDGLDLLAWYLAPATEPVTTILLAPGNAGNRAGRVPTASALNERGHAVLLLDYRGYGGNPGRPSEVGLVADARAAHDHLLARADVEVARIVYLGESLGSAVVAALAAERPPAAVVLRSPFPELADVGRAAYPFLPVRALLRDRHPTSDHLDVYGGPVLVVAGASDRIVPSELSREVARRTEATFVEVPGVGHNDPELFVGERFVTAVDAHLRAAVGDAP
jgi:uncharacterized protein